MGGRGRCRREAGDVCGSERKIAKIVCRLIKRKQNLPINEMWQLSVNFIGARLAGDDDDDAGAGWRHLATHPTPVGVGVGTEAEAEAEAEAFLPCLDVDSCDTHLQALPDIGDGVSMAGSRVVSYSSPLRLSLSSSSVRLVVCFVCPISHTVAATAASVRKSYIS